MPENLTAAMVGPVDRWWEHLDPAPVVDEWMAKQVIRFHENGGGVCAGCGKGEACQRLADARRLVPADGSTTEPSAAVQRGSTVRR